jgi:hypothetical protein
VRDEALPQSQTMLMCGRGIAEPSTTRSVVSQCLAIEDRALKGPMVADPRREMNGNGKQRTCQICERDGCGARARPARHNTGKDDVVWMVDLGKRCMRMEEDMKRPHCVAKCETGLRAERGKGWKSALN